MLARRDVNSRDRNQTEPREQEAEQRGQCCGQSRQQKRGRERRLWFRAAEFWTPNETEEAWRKVAAWRPWLPLPDQEQDNELFGRK